MTVLTDLKRHFGNSEFIQLCAGFFIILVLGIAITWPNSVQAPNNSFYTVVQLRIGMLVLLALAYGSAVTHLARHQKISTLLALLVLAVVSSPVEITAYAISFPQQSLLWGLFLSLLDTVAYFGFGLLLGYVFTILRLRPLLPLALPATIAGLIAFDIYLGIPVFNPFTTITVISYPHLISMITLGILTLTVLALPWKAPHDSTQ